VKGIIKAENKAQALQIQKQFQDLAQKHGAWLKITHDFKPDLKMIEIEKISIKVD